MGAKLTSGKEWDAVARGAEWLSWVRGDCCKACHWGMIIQRAAEARDNKQYAIGL